MKRSPLTDNCEQKIKQKLRELIDKHIEHEKEKHKNGPIE
jgi:hypothetical protein